MIGYALEKVRIIVSAWQDDFVAALEAQGCSRKTIKDYRHDLANFERWFVKNNGQPLSPELITGVDVHPAPPFDLPDQFQ